MTEHIEGCFHFSRTKFHNTNEQSDQKELKVFSLYDRALCRNLVDALLRKAFYMNSDQMKRGDSLEEKHKGYAYLYIRRCMVRYHSYTYH